MKQAVIDLGTNTFHLLIVQKKPNAARPDSTYETLFRESRPAKIGRAAGGGGGINQRLITDDAIGRALDVLTYFRQVLDEHQIDPASVAVFGTSAIRVAQNQQAFVDQVRTQTGLLVRVISGDEEAGLIYRGVRASGALSDETALIMDIGGGSVEFIIGSADRLLWKQSFEIGGQRLMERFMGESDRLSPAAVGRLHSYFQEQLLPLTNAIHQYHPSVLVGSSGTFDTLIDMQYQHEQGVWPPAEQAAFELPIAEFYRAYELLLTRNHDERMAIPGMIELRVDMIVVAVVLIAFVLKTYGINAIRVSTYALKEGVLSGE
ncbi:Ppx/GppA phosphatase [Fibrella aestuarina BUZ 2]|uniref:Ppx/GppA phosphatase n=1 Tax=Fibrella aestuarina BUZ 2 TaxID=1166018 RepID=I0KAC6_9BACT|nr:Ppx/GppA phosphatase [Fibrella aestuarina]CCH01079.1 Ppx/GppA phosphatase [Fibrella aestuarina BUZ 2]